MNVLLYYPRLFIALFLRPAPRSLAAFHHWNMVQLFLLWNAPWQDENDSLAVETVRKVSKREDVRADDPKVRRAALAIRLFYLCVMLYWPFISLLISIRKKKLRFLPYWDVVVNNLFLITDRPKTYDPQDSLTLTHLSLYVPLLYVVTKTGQRVPDKKRRMYERCRECGIPTPRVFGATDTCPSTGSYIVKPIAGYGGQGIVFTSDPSPYVGDSRVIVQEVVRNPPELRRLWNSNTLGTIRMMTLNFGDRFELAGPSHIKVPVGDSTTDNFGQGNVFAMIDRSGRLSPLYKTRNPSAGLTHHPTTGIAAEDIVIPRYEECIELAMMAHQRLAPHLPFFNSDIAITEHGPMLIEINRIPGLPTLMFDEQIVSNFVEATALAVERVTNGQQALANADSSEAFAAPQPQLAGG